MTSEFEKKLNDMERQSEIIRGRIIDAAITIENYISIVLTDLFPKENVKALFDKYIMSDTLDFNKKKEILCSLIKNDEIVVENIYSTFSQDLQIIQDLRNIIAHTTLITTKEVIENYDGTILKYVSFSRKFWQKEITILMKTADIENENIKKDIYSFSSYITRITNVSNVLNK